MKKRTTKKQKEERTLDDLLENNPEILAANFRIAKLGLMQIKNTTLNEFKQIIEKRNYLSDLSDQKIMGFFTETEKEDMRLAEELEKADFWITPSISVDFLLKLQKLSKQHKIASRKIEGVFLEQYNMKNYFNLKSMVQSWKESPYFVRRMKIINDAKDAHINQKYTLSIPTIIPQIEGILSSLTSKPAGHPSKIFEEIFLERYSDINHSMSKSIIHKLALGPSLYGGIPNEYFVPERYDKWVKTHKKTNDLLINRHAILHGVQINYASESNSLRAFLLLDVLYWMSKD